MVRTGRRRDHQAIGEGPFFRGAKRRPETTGLLRPCRDKALRFGIARAGSLSLIARRRCRAPGRRLPHTGNAPSARTRPLPRRLGSNQRDIRQAHRCAGGCDGDTDHRDGSRREESLRARSGFALPRCAPTASVARRRRRAGVGDSLATAEAVHGLRPERACRIGPTLSHAISEGGKTEPPTGSSGHRGGAVFPRGEARGPRHAFCARWGASGRPETTGPLRPCRDRVLRFGIARAGLAVARCEHTVRLYAAARLVQAERPCSSSS